MVDTALPKGRRAATAPYAIQQLTDAHEIRLLLDGDNAYTAYARAQLEPELFPQSDWWSASGASGRAIVVHSRGGLGHALVTIGDPTALDAVLGLHPGPRYAFASFRPEHLEAMRRHFLLARTELMVRMYVTRETFRPVDGEAVHLTGRNIAQINRLYATEGGSPSYTSRHIDQGVYCGVIVDGKLVSIAGTHVNAPGERVAVVGNVFTHPRYRGGGLATVATSAVTRLLMDRCDLVALTVELSNAPAVAVYDRLGYRQHCTLYETGAVRKDALGVATVLRRLVAGWRGRALGKEIVLR